MAQASYQCTIQSPYETLWQALMDEVDNPHHYSDTIQKVEITERFHNGVLRVLSVPDADVRERVIYDYSKGTVVSNLVGHPSLVGTITIKVVDATPESKPPLTLECQVEWESIDQGVGSMIRRNIESFFNERLDYVKKEAEKKA